MHVLARSERLARLVALVSVGCSLIVIVGCGQPTTAAHGSHAPGAAGSHTPVATATASPALVPTPTVSTLPTPQPALCSPGSNAAPLPSTDRTLYVSTNQGIVAALNAADGSKHWSFSAGAGAYPSITPDGATVYITFDTGAGAPTQLVALGAADGAVRWKVSLQPEPYAGTVSTRLQMAGDVVYATTSNGSLLALDSATGTQRWSTSISPGLSYSSLELAGGVLYAEFVSRNTQSGQAPSGVVAAVRIGDGTVLWRATSPATTYMPPVVANGLVYAAETPTTLTALDAATGTPRWRVDLGVGFSPRSLHSAVAVGTGLYVNAGVERDNAIYAFDASTGALCWTAPGAGSGATSAPVLDGTTLYGTAFCGDPGPPSAGTGCVFALDAQTGAQRWSIRVSGAYGGIAPDALVNNALYVSNCPVFSVRAESGATLWSDTEPQFFNGFTVNLGQVQVIGTTAYVAYTDGTVRALSATDGSSRWSVTLAGQIATLAAGA